MRHSFWIALLGMTALASGCATKGYVRQQTEPIQTQVSQVSEQANRQGQELQQTRQDVQQNRTAIQAVDEKASAAERRAGDAMARAEQVGEQSSREINALRQVIANIDDYQVAGEATVLFGFDRATLTAEGRQQLDQLASQASSHKRYFVAVEGYTDSIGSPEYNLELSKRRAEAVVQYLAAEKGVPFYLIHTIGLGEVQPADTGTGAAARARNRRVEVKLFSADAATAAASASN